MAAHLARPALALPLDVWLLVFDELDDLTLLWSVCRNVCRFLRSCVDAFFRHGIVQNTFVDLHYSDFHTRAGPLYSFVHVPMAFDRFSDDGRRVVLQQRAYKSIEGGRIAGSVRGWVPFVERYCEEIGQPKPTVLNKSPSDIAPPLWEREHLNFRKKLHGEAKLNHIYNLGDMAAIGRGDRPPFYIKVKDTVDDTHIVDLTIDCKQREISFDWRKTYALFFREQNFIAWTSIFSADERSYDKELDAVAAQNPAWCTLSHDGRARQKRLKTWLAKNRHRMCPEIRLWTLGTRNAQKALLVMSLKPSNLAPLLDVSDDEPERVPQKLAKDHADLMLWPWMSSKGFVVAWRKPFFFQWRVSCCIL